MPLNKFQYNQRIEIINNIVEKLRKNKPKVEYITDLCKIIAKEASLIELDTYVKNPEKYKSKPKQIAYQTLLTNKDYKMGIEILFEEFTSKSTNQNKVNSFEKDLEISNLKEKIRRLELYIANISSNEKLPINGKNEDNRLNNAYNLLYDFVNTYKDFISIDIKKGEVLNLAEFPPKRIGGIVENKEFIEFISKNRLKNT